MHLVGIQYMQMLCMNGLLISYINFIGITVNINDNKNRIHYMRLLLSVSTHVKQSRLYFVHIQGIANNNTVNKYER
jgi:hypothetical protein